MNTISAWSIRNPVPTIVMFLVLTVAGIYGFLQLRTNSQPDLDLPTVTVTVTQAGASPSELEIQVAQVVENAVASLDGVDSLSSTLNEGTSTTTVEFTLNTDVDRATNDVRNAVSGIQSDLPGGASTPIINRRDTTGSAILTFVVDSPEMAPDVLSWFIDKDIARVLLGVSGVSKIERSGGVDRVIKIELDDNRLAAFEVGAAYVSQTLATLNIDQPGGRTTIGNREHSVRTLGSANSVEELAATRIPLPNGQVVQLSDLGKISDSWEAPRQRARFQNNEVVAFSVFRSVGSSEVDVTEDVREAVHKIDKGDDKITVTEVTSSSGFVESSYDAALEALWIGALLAVGVVWLFLRDIRATLVAAVALPLSLIPTFAVMAWIDLSLNTITLLALSLVVGILVDDAIVEIENIVRHRRESGKSSYQAAIEAADEIGLAVVATTAAIIAIFLPVAFMPGIPGKFFINFAVATCVSVAFSLLVARTLTPLMGAYFLKSGGKEAREPLWISAYLALLRRALVWRLTTLGLGLVFLIGSALLASRLPTEFIAPVDRGRAIVSLELAPGSTIEETDAIVKRVTERLHGEPDVKSIFASIGSPQSSGGGPNASQSAGEVRSATITVNLLPESERKRSQQEFEADLSAKLSDLPGARIQFGADAQSGSKVSVTLVGNNRALLDSAINLVLSDIRKIRGLLNPRSTASTTRPEVIITPDDARAAEAGISARDVAETINIATLGDTDRNLAKFNLGDRQISILVTLAAGVLDDPARLARLPVTGTKQTVPLGSIATISFGAGPNSINRIERNSSATIEAELSGITLGQANAAIGALPTMKNLPEGVNSIERGDTAIMTELFSGFIAALVAGVLLMYATLVLLFRGFLQPITILMALPFSLGGALGLLWLSGYAIGISALIGILMLMGIAAKNSILLVEYALLAARNQQIGRIDALLEAARKRARPIVMTSVAMCVGMLPLALGIGADAETRAPMAVTVIGGLISSTILSLVFVPVVYTLMDDLQNYLGRVLGWLIVKPSPEEVEV